MLSKVQVVLMRRAGGAAKRGTVQGMFLSIPLHAQLGKSVFMKSLL